MPAQETHASEPAHSRGLLRTDASAQHRSMSDARRRDPENEAEWTPGPVRPELKSMDLTLQKIHRRNCQRSHVTNESRSGHRPSRLLIVPLVFRILFFPVFDDADLFRWLILRIRRVVPFTLNLRRTVCRRGIIN